MNGAGRALQKNAGLGRTDQSVMLPQFGQLRRLKDRKRNDFRALDTAGHVASSYAVLLIAKAISFPKTARRKTVCVTSSPQWHCSALVHQRQKPECIIIIAITIPTVIPKPDGLPPGADGTCARRWVAIPVRSTTSRGHGLTLAPMLVGPRLAPSLYGPITSAKSSVTKTGSGSSRAAMTAMAFGHARDRWRVPLRSERPKRHLNRQNPFGDRLRVFQLARRVPDVERPNWPRRSFPTPGSFRVKDTRIASRRQRAFRLFLNSVKARPNPLTPQHSRFSATLCDIDASVVARRP
jgi:hypothetical protein